LDQGGSQATLPVQRVPHQVLTIENVDPSEDGSDGEFYTLRRHNSEGEEGDDDDSTITMDGGSFAMESDFEDLNLHGKIDDARAPEKGINGDRRNNMRAKKEEEESVAGAGCGARATIHEKEKEVDENDPIVRQLVNALFP
jgi:hypothetical protein